MTEHNEPIQEAVLVERGLYEQVVEGLREIANTSANATKPSFKQYIIDREYWEQKSPGGLSQWLAQRLLAKLEAHRAEE